MFMEFLKETKKNPLLLRSKQYCLVKTKSMIFCHERIKFLIYCKAFNLLYNSSISSFKAL